MDSTVNLDFREDLQWLMAKLLKMDFVGDRSLVQTVDPAVIREAIGRIVMADEYVSCHCRCISTDSNRDVGEFSGPNSNSYSGDLMTLDYRV